MTRFMIHSGFSIPFDTLRHAFRFECVLCASFNGLLSDRRRSGDPRLFETPLGKNRSLENIYDTKIV